MDILSSMNNALAYIEEHLTDDIDYSKVSKVAFCSEYHFKRMFSFLSGYGLGQPQSFSVYCKAGTLRSHFVECLFCFFDYCSTSTVKPDLNSTLNLSS